MIYARDSVTEEFINQEVARGKTYYLVLLLRGPRERNDQVWLDELQVKHLQHLFRFRQSGKLVLNGPALSDSEFRDICIYHGVNQEEVQGFVEADPLVQAGFLTVEIFPWMGLPGDRLP